MSSHTLSSRSRFPSDFFLGIHFNVGLRARTTFLSAIIFWFLRKTSIANYTKLNIILETTIDAIQSKLMMTYTVLLILFFIVKRTARAAKDLSIPPSKAAHA